MKTWYYLVFYAFLIVASGAGTFLKILPETTFLTVLTLIIGYHTGLITPSPSTLPPPLVLAQPPLATQSIEEAQAAQGPAPGTYVGVHPNPSAKDMRAAISEQTANNVTTSTPQS